MSSHPITNVYYLSGFMTPSANLTMKEESTQLQTTFYDSEVVNSGDGIEPNISPVARQVNDGDMLEVHLVMFNTSKYFGPAPENDWYFYWLNPRPCLYEERKYVTKGVRPFTSHVEPIGRDPITGHSEILLDEFTVKFLYDDGLWSDMLNLMEPRKTDDVRPFYQRALDVFVARGGLTEEEKVAFLKRVAEATLSLPSRVENSTEAEQIQYYRPGRRD